MTEFPRLETERLFLREYQSADVDELATIYSDPEVVRFLAQGQTRSRAECQERLTAAIFRWNQYRLPIWAVTLKATGRWIGRCGFQPKEDDEPEVVELAYGYARWAWGHGYATEAGLAMARWAFDQGIEQVIALVRPTNSRAAAMVRRIGMEWIGETEKYHDLRLQVFRLRPGDLSAG